MYGYLVSTSSTLPSNAVWKMGCSTVNTFSDHTITIAAPTCICKLGYSGDNCEVGSAPPACDGDGAAGKQMVLSGACERQSGLNGAFILQGNTKDGKEYFANGGKYLYYDSDCFGHGETASARWMFGNDKPSETASQDLAGDGGTCSLSGYLVPTSSTFPSNAAWLVFCENAWTDVTITIAPPTCICKQGYSGEDCQTNINECAGQTCSNHGTCSDQVNGFKCNCVAGWSGATCATNINECAGQACSNHGTCSDQVNSFKCNCVAGWSGATCATNIDECAGQTCSNHGTCSDQVNSFKCNCVAGWSGATCAKNINECAGQTCS
eukprot:gene33132-biopygen22695